MKTNLLTIKRLTLLLVLVLAAVLASVQPAHAAGVCPSPGTNLPGALNMLHDAGMFTIPLAPQGDAGMWIAVINTYCP